MRLPVIISFLLISSLESASAQNAYFKMGQQAFLQGDIRSAISHLEKACITDSTNANALWMLGYSYYHSNNYKKSIAAFKREIAIKPSEANAYYYMARAKGYLGRDNQATDADKELYLLQAIVDFTKAIALNNDPTDNNNRYYQNRGIAYRDYAAFRLSPGTKFYDKARGVGALKLSIVDFEKVLNSNPARTDISSQIDQSKEKLTQVSASSVVVRH